MGYWLAVVVLFFAFGTELQVYSSMYVFDVRTECEVEADNMLTWHRANREIPGPMFYHTVCIPIRLGKGINYGGTRPYSFDGRS